MLSDHRTPERLLNDDLRVERQDPCPSPSSPGAAPATRTDKINKKVLFKLLPLWVYLKSSRQLQYIITNQQERGRRDREGRRRGGGQKHPGLFLVKKWLSKDGRGKGLLKMPPRVRVSERECFRGGEQSWGGNLGSACE